MAAPYRDPNQSRVVRQQNPARPPRRPDLSLYNHTSQAYDLSLFEPHGVEVEDKYTVHRKSQDQQVGGATGEQLPSKTQIYRIKKQRSRARTFRVVVSCILLVAALGITGSIIYNQVQLTELTAKIDTTSKNLEESRSVYTQLQMRSNASLSLATVESFAKTNLGMRKIDQSQLVFIELSQGDKGQVVQDNNGDNFFTNLWNNIKNFLS